MTNAAYQDNGRLLTLFVIFLTLSLAALIGAWVRGRKWGDLSSRQHYGEALSEEERKALRRSRRDFCIWAGASLIFAAFAFWALR